MDEFLANALDDLDRRGLRRRLTPLQRADARHAVLDGRTLINFASNNYLGLSHHPAVVEAAASAAREAGAGAGASRLLSGTLDLHTKLEASLAAFKGTESALAFPTGYMAAVGAIPALAGDGAAVLMDKLNHASLIDGGRLAAQGGATLRVYPHGNWDKLERLLERHDRSAPRLLIVTDSLFSMDGDLADLPRICDLAERHGASVMIDEAHATGTFGENGRGAAEHFGVEERVRVHMGTLSKALGGLGGYIAGGADLIELLRNRARTFLYTTAAPAPVIAAAIAAIEVVRTDEGRRRRETLRANAARLRRGLTERDLDIGASASQIVPVILPEIDRMMSVAAGLRERGFLVGAIRPPTVPTPRLRVSVTAMHTPEDIDGFLDAAEELI